MIHSHAQTLQPCVRRLWRSVTERLVVQQVYLDNLVQTPNIDILKSETLSLSLRVYVGLSRTSNYSIKGSIDVSSKSTDLGERNRGMDESKSGRKRRSHSLSKIPARQVEEPYPEPHIYRSHSGGCCEVRGCKPWYADPQEPGRYDRKCVVARCPLSLSMQVYYCTYPRSPQWSGVLWSGIIGNIKHSVRFIRSKKLNSHLTGSQRILKSWQTY